MKKPSTSKKLPSAEHRLQLLELLEDRFEKHPSRHPNVQWSEVRSRLEAAPEKIWSVNEMEISGGEPDVVGRDPQSEEFIFCDCSPQSPKGRTSLCYDRVALDLRKEPKPKDSAVEVAAAMGIELLNELQYQELQKVGEFDTTTTSWIKTPESVRKLGGALFGDNRYGRVFIYHNGAQSYFGSRGFRGSLRV
jgi:hypothetical protein